MKGPIPRRDRTPDENLAVTQLGTVTFPVASWDKRFFRNISSVETITRNEAAQLWRIFIKYRRQMSFPGKDELLRMAEGLAAPDFRKLAAIQSKQEQIDALKRKYAESMAS